MNRPKLTPAVLAARYRDETVRQVIAEWARVRRSPVRDVQMYCPALARALDALHQEYRET